MVITFIILKSGRTLFIEAEMAMAVATVTIVASNGFFQKKFSYVSLLMAMPMAFGLW